MEARWYHSGYTPTIEEYLNNAWITISGPVVLAHAYFSMRLKVTKEVLEGIENSADLIRFASTISRLCDDMGTSTVRAIYALLVSSLQLLYLSFSRITFSFEYFRQCICYCLLHFLPVL